MTNVCYWILELRLLTTQSLLIGQYKGKGVGRVGGGGVVIVGGLCGLGGLAGLISAKPECYCGWHHYSCVNKVSKHSKHMFFICLFVH